MSGGILTPSDYADEGIVLQLNLPRPEGATPLELADDPTAEGGGVVTVQQHRESVARLTQMGLPQDGEFHRYSFWRPVVLTPVPAVFGAQREIPPVVAAPHQAGVPGTPAIGSFFAAPQGRVYISSPGVWWLQMQQPVGGPFPDLRMQVVEVPDRTFAEMLLHPETQSVQYEDVVVPAATETLLVSLFHVRQATWLYMRNRGANGARLTFGDTIATAAVGLDLPADDGAGAYNGAAAVFNGAPRKLTRGEIPSGQLNAFSTLGTTINVTVGLSELP